MGDGQGYVLGHSEAEIRRLETQARLVDPITRRFLVAAGIVEGMRVLDVGSGGGDTALLLAGLIGPAGAVVGVDTSATAVAAAGARLAAAGVVNVSFRRGDPAAMRFEQPFDAVVGRYVLMFQPDPAAMLAGVVRHLRPGGVVVFHEPDWEGARCNPPVEAFNRVAELNALAFAGSGADQRLGGRLPAVFAAAGLPAPTLRIEATIGAGAAAVDVVHLATDVARTLRPELERQGLVAAGESDFSAMADAILAALGPHGTVIGRSEVGAWTRV